MKDPDRGEVWLVDLGIVAKVRPCLVVSISVLDEDRALVTLVSHTTSIRGSRFEVSFRVNFLKKGVFDAQSLTTTVQAKLLRRIGILSVDQLSAVEDAVRLWLKL